MSQVFDAQADSAGEPHVVRRLGLVAREHGDGLLGELAIRPDLKAPGTSLPLLGPVGSFCDTIGGVLAAIGAYPTPIATADLTIVIDPRVAPTVLRTQPSIVRAGRSTVITEMVLDDAPTGHRSAYCTMSSTVLSTARPQVVDPRMVTKFFHNDHVARAAHFYDEVGIVDEGDGRVVLELAPFLGNSMGMLHGGVTVMLAEAAALSAARVLLGSDRPLAALEAQVRYINGARSGPVLASGEVVAAGAGWASVKVHQHDLGRDRLTSTALVRVDTPA